MDRGNYEDISHTLKNNFLKKCIHYNNVYLHVLLRNKIKYYLNIFKLFIYKKLHQRIFA